MTCEDSDDVPKEWSETYDGLDTDEVDYGAEPPTKYLAALLPPL